MRAKSIVSTIVMAALLVFATSARSQSGGLSNEDMVAVDKLIDAFAESDEDNTSTP